MLEGLDAPYMQRAVAIGVVLAVPLGLLGAWIVVRDLAFFAHAVGVATFPGLTVGVALPALGPFVGALVAALGFAAAISAAESDQRVRGGAVTGLALALALAAGAVLLTVLGVGAAPVERLLFGSLLGVSDADLLRAAAVALVSSAALGLLGPRLNAISFDRGWARAAGAGERASSAALLVLASVVVVAALPAVGALLVSALLVIPAATARLLTARLGPLLGAAVALCVVETVVGLAVAQAVDLPPGVTVAALAGVGFGLVACGRVASTRWSAP